MTKLTIKNLVIFAVIVGVVVGLAAGFAKSAVQNNQVAAADDSVVEPDQGDVFGSDWGLSGEHDQQWLIEGALGGFQNLHSGSSNDPETLRSLLEDQGIEVPEGASTHELRNLLSGSGGPGGFFDHSPE